MAQLTVGLDLGNRWVKRVRLRSSFRNVEVVDFSRIELPQDNRPRFERLQEALQKLMDDHDPRELMATTLPGDEVSIRILKLPFTDRKKIDQTVGFELDSQIPFSPEQVLYGYLKIDQTADGGSRLLVAHCSTVQMDQWLKFLNGMGIDPKLVGAESLAYSSLMSQLPGIEGDGAFALVDVGHRLTSICIFGPVGTHAETTGLHFGRTLSGGGRDITKQLAEMFKVDEARAEQGKQREAFIESPEQHASSPEQVMVSDAIGRASAPLMLGLRQTFASYRSQFQKTVKKIYLCGGGAAVRNFDRHLASGLNLEVERITPQHFNLPGIEKLSENSTDTSWAKALGLALHAHEGGRQGFLNLRRGSFSFQGDFQYLRGKISHVTIATIIIIFLALGYAIIRYLSLSSAERSLEQKMGEVVQTILKKPMEDPEKAIAIIREKSSPTANPLPRVSALDVLREIHEKIPTTVKLRMKEIDIGPKKVQLTGFTQNFESVDTIKSELEKYKCFSEIQTGKTQKTQDESEVKFEFIVVFGC